MSLPLFNDKIDSFSSICAAFLKDFQVVPAILKAGMKKAKGVSVASLFGFLFSSIFTPGSSFLRQMDGNGGDIPSYRGTHRLLEAEGVDWNKVVAGTASKVISSVLEPADKERGGCFRCLVADDTPFRRDRSKAVEKATKCYDHSTHRFFTGYRDLHLVYTDGATTIPVSHCLMSSRDESVDEAEEKDAGQLSCMQMNDVLFELLGKAGEAGVEADYLLFDSWFASPKDIRRGVEKGYKVTAMLKRGRTKYLCGDGVQRTVKEIFRTGRKRRGRSRYLLSTRVKIAAAEEGGEDLEARLVFVRNRANRKEWLVLLTTDMSLDEDGVVACYSCRWAIECFFKTYKQDLRVTSRCRARKFTVVNANCAVAMLQYMFLSVQRRISVDQRTIGELFVSVVDEGTEEAVARLMGELCSLFAEKVSEAFNIPRAELEKTVLEVLAAFLSSFAISMERAA